MPLCEQRRYRGNSTKDKTNWLRSLEISHVFSSFNDYFAVKDEEMWNIGEGEFRVGEIEK